MALDKLVDSTQLDGAMTATANAIRGKTGDSNTIEWDLTNGFKSAVEAIPSGSTVNIQANKTATPSTSQQIIQPDSGYDALGQVTVNGISPTKAAQTYTPTTSNQVIQSGRWLSGDQTILGDANLVAANIADGVSIFGVSGTHSGGSMEYEDGIIDKTISGTYINTRLSKIGTHAFYYCNNLSTVSFPECTTIGDHVFYYCNNLSTVSFPRCITIGNSAFYSCTKLSSASFPSCTTIINAAFYCCYNLSIVSFPKCATIGAYAFYGCYSLSTVSFPACTSIGNSAFRNCYILVSIYLTGSSYVSLAASGAFVSTPIGGYSNIAGRYGSIYVPASMLASYKTMTNWTYFSSRFVRV